MSAEPPLEPAAPSRSAADPTRPTEPADPQQGASEQSQPASLLARIGADWAAVIVAGLLVLLAGLGLLPSIPFLIK